MDRSEAIRILDTDVIAQSLRTELGVPLHRQLEVTMRGLIRSGGMHVGDQLPGEHELAAALGVSRHTVRHALGVLAGEGLVRRDRGRGGGTRIVSTQPGAGAIERRLDSFYAFAWETHARGAEQRSYVLARETVPANAELAVRLRLPEQTPLERIVRLRTANAEPLVHETSYLPATLAKSLTLADLEVGSIYDVLEQRLGIGVARAHETLRPIAVRGAAARLLHVRAGAPAFAVERLTFAAERPIEWQESIVRGDRFSYTVELTRAGTNGVEES